MTRKEKLKNRVLNGGRGSGQSLRLLCEVYENKIAELLKENRLLGKRCNQLLKDKGDLIDKIADILANCDLAIEGRDLEIIELKNLIAKRENANIELFDFYEKKLEENEQLKAQIEKMKRCEICKHFRWNCC